MIDISFHILDLVQNSITAGASLIEIHINLIESIRVITISDNGCGMDTKVIANAMDPFYTSRTTRKVGLGIPLFKETCEQANGSMTINSTNGGGIVLTGKFDVNHLDAIELGNIGEALYILLSQNKNIAFRYLHQAGRRIFSLHSSEIYENIEPELLLNSEVMRWLEQYINQQIQYVEGEKNENTRGIESITQ